MDLSTKSRKSLSCLSATIVIVILGLLSTVLILKTKDSLYWRMEHDTPLLHYAAFMMNEYHAVPYRDFFETSMPGTFIFHYIVRYLFEFGDAGLQAVNVILLLLLLLCICKTLKCYGWISAWSGSVLFGLIYLSAGKPMVLQRDYLGVIPIAVVFMLMAQNACARLKRWRFFITGMLYGLASTIKPHLVITLPVAIYGLWKTPYHQIEVENRPKVEDSKNFKAKIISICMVIAGLGLVWLPIVVWLVMHRAWDAFLQTILIYLPLHSKITGAHTVLTGWPRVHYLFDSTFKFSGLGLLVIAGIFGWYNALYCKYFIGHRRIMAKMIICCAILYAGPYPVLAGKFWPYHYMPMIYFMVLSAVLALADSNPQISIDSGMPNDKRPERFAQSPVGKHVWSVILIFLAFSIQLDLPNEVKTSFTNWNIKVSEAQSIMGRADQIGIWLAMNATPGDTVQPLDWTGGAIHGMLKAKVPLATRFMYDYHFFHHVSDPFIQQLRKEFIHSLNQNPPRFIIEVDTDQPRVSGKDTSSVFPELKQFIGAHYRLAFHGVGFAVLERKTDRTIR